MSKTNGATVETGMFTHGEVDEVKYAKFVAKNVASNLRARARGVRDFAHMTEAECVAAAESYCRAYQHQFRVLVAA